MLPILTNSLILSFIYFEFRGLQGIIVHEIILPQPLRQLHGRPRYLPLVLDSNHWPAPPNLFKLLYDDLFVILCRHDLRFQSKVHLLVFLLLVLVDYVIRLGLNIQASITLIFLNFNIPALIIVILLTILWWPYHLTTFKILILNFSSKAIDDHRTLLWLKYAWVYFLGFGERLLNRLPLSRRGWLQRPWNRRAVAFFAKRFIDWFLNIVLIYWFTADALLQVSQWFISPRTGAKVATSRDEWRRTLCRLPFARRGNLDVPVSYVHYVKHEYKP